MTTSTIDEKKPGVIEFNIEEAFLKSFKIRMAGSREKSSIEVALPYELMLKLARQKNLPLREFVRTHRAHAYYCGGNEVFYRIIEDPLSRTEETSEE